jgi:hypothetical protein
LEIGAAADALLFGKKGSVRCRARVVRRERGPRGELGLAMNIVEIAPEGAWQIQEMLAGVAS